MNIHFEKAHLTHKELIFNWLEEPHIKEFWDNSQEHKNDILNFITSRKQHYFYGTTNYWIGFINNEPFNFYIRALKKTTIYLIFNENICLNQVIR